MEVRAIRPEEYLEAQNVMSIAFRYERKEEPANDTGEKHHDIYGAFSPEGRMASCVVANPLRVYYWGEDVGMCGVGGVSTLPEDRGEGYVSTLMRYVMEQAYRRGDLLAALYPFSHTFYRKFGFENGAAMNFVTAEREAFADFPMIGRVRQYFPDQDREPILRVYRAFARNRNFACLRTDEMWSRRLEQDPYVSHVHTYLWENDQGVAEGYFTLLHEKENGKKFYQAQDWAFTSFEAVRGMLGFFRQLLAGGPQARLMLPGDVNPFLLFPEPYHIQVRREAHGMLRVVNMEKCLLLHPWPEGTDFAVRVHDPVISCNDGAFRVRRETGRTLVERTEGPADIEASIQAISLLLAGAADLIDVTQNRTDCRVPARLEELARAFPRNPIQLQERF